MPSFEDLQRINKANSIINRSSMSLGIRPMYLHTEPEEEDTQEELFEALEENFIIEEVEISQEKEIIRNNSLTENFKRNIQEKLKEAKKQEIITAEEYYAQIDSLDENFCLEDFADIEEEPHYIETQTEHYQENENAQVEVYYKEPKTFFDAEELNAEPLFASSKKESKPQEFRVESNFSFSKTAIYTACAVITAVFLIFAFKPVSTAPDTNKKLEATKLQELTKTVNSNEPRSLIITSGNFLEKNEAESYKQALNSKLGIPLKIIAEENTFSVQIGPAYANHDDALLVFDELSRYSVKNLSIRVAV